MRILFGYDDVIYDGDVTLQKQHYYYNRYENISVPINGHNIIHKTVSLASNERYDHLTVSNYQYPIDSIIRNNGYTVDRACVSELITCKKKFVYTLSLKYIMRVHTNIIPGEMRIINDKKLLCFNYFKAVLSFDHIQYINNNMCLLVLCDIAECSWYTRDMLENLKLICIEAGIDYTKILILTSNVHNSENINIKKSGINVQYWQYWESVIRHCTANRVINYNSVKPSKYKFLLLNSKSRRHRYYLCYKLWQCDKNFFKNFCVSLDRNTLKNLQTCNDYAARDGFINSITFFDKMKDKEAMGFNNFLSLLPFITEYDKGFIKNKLNSVQQYKQNICNHTSSVDFFKINHWDNIPQEMIHNTDIHVVTESLIEIENTYEYSHLFLTEKTFKPIALKAPFIIAAQPGALVHLRSVGYKTFHECWCEDYDLIANPQERIESIINTILSIIDKPTSEYNDLITRAYEIAEYNYNVFKARVPEKDIVDTISSFFK